MDEVILIRRLKEMSKLDYPEDWEEMVKTYIETKKRMIKLKRKRGLDTSGDEEHLLEAIEFIEKWR